ncbi:sialin, partial [Biomphalaria glabrata]
PLFFSQRIILALLSFVGTLLVYVTRVNISVAIICMVRNPQTNATTAWNSSGVNGTLNVTLGAGVCGDTGVSAVDKDTND